MAGKGPRLCACILTNDKAMELCCLLHILLLHLYLYLAVVTLFEVWLHAYKICMIKSSCSLEATYLHGNIPELLGILLICRVALSRLLTTLAVNIRHRF